MKKIIIAIDGYSSCGKSSFAKAIAARLGYLFIDSGAMYRAVTLFARQQGLIENGKVKERELAARLNEIDLSFRYNPENRKSDIWLNGVDVEKQIRSMEVSRDVSAVSAVSAVRDFLVARQQQMGRDKGVVMDGRDIGTVVFPDAELKLFMTAAPKVRAERRYKELQAQGVSVRFEDILRNIEERDRIDTGRAVGPLRQAEDAVLLDNSDLTLPEQMEWVMRLIEERTRPDKTGRKTEIFRK